MQPYRPDEAFAREADAADPLARFRERFWIPRAADGREVAYFCGNSLGLQPKATRQLFEQELDDWAKFGVGGHFHARTPWYSYHEVFHESAARLVGAVPGEVVLMNSLTVNLHLMMVTFYRPTRGQRKILIDAPTFPSDLYAVKTQIRHHGYDPADTLLLLEPRPSEATLRTEDVEQTLDRQGSEIALLILSGVNFFTGQWFDIPRITAAGQAKGCIVGWDLAHAAGNVPLQLHAWNPDFAVWCNYKYVNGGPGAAGGCFVHERHGRNLDLPRFAGWWGNDPATRFEMHRQLDFLPREGADGWQISNPPIFSMTPLIASLAIFDDAGIENLRAKSERLTGYLEFLLDRLPPGRIEIITPRESARRGCQLSLRVRERPRELFQALEQSGIVCDFREPDVIRFAPVPLYNSYADVWRLSQVLAASVR